jgi:hypothetical protein
MMSPKTVFCQSVHSTDTHRKPVGTRLYAELCMGRREGEKKLQKKKKQKQKSYSLPSS